MEETGGPKSDDGWPDIAVGYYLDPEHVGNGASGGVREWTGIKSAMTKIKRQGNHTWNQFGTDEISKPINFMISDWCVMSKNDTYVSFLVENEESLSVMMRLCWILYGMLPHWYHVQVRRSQRLAPGRGKGVPLWFLSIWMWSMRWALAHALSSTLTCLIWEARSSSSTCWPFQSRRLCPVSPYCIRFTSPIWAPSWSPPRPVVCHRTFSHGA